MSSPETPFIVVICHGSYHTPEPYQSSLPAPKAQNIESYRPPLPSSDFRRINIGDVTNPQYNSDPPPSGYPQPADDAAVLNELPSQLILRSGKRVLLVEHPISSECGSSIPMGESVRSFSDRPKTAVRPSSRPNRRFHLRLPCPNGGHLGP